MMYSGYAVISFVFILILSISTVTAIHETEPNDSLEQPQILGEEMINGTVRKDDTDIYSVEMKKGDLHVIYLNKLGSDLEPINITIYDENKDPVRSSRDHVKIPGEIFDWGEIPDRNTKYYIVVSGKGHYSLEHVHHRTGDPDDTGDLHEVMTLENGDVVTGKVLVIREKRIEAYQYVDLDRFKVNMEADEDLTVTVTRKDSDGKMYVEFSSRNRDHVRNKTLESRDEEEKFDYTADAYYPQDVFITISGEGEYEINIEKEGGTQEDDLLLTFTFCGMFVCIPFIGFLLIVIIIIVVIVIIVRANRDR